MNTIKTIFSVIGLAIVSLLAILLIFSFTGLILAFVAGVLVLLFLMWLCGFPIQVKIDGVPTGYIRWTKYHRY